MDYFVRVQEIQSAEDLTRYFANLRLVKRTVLLQFLGKAPLAHKFHVDEKLLIKFFVV